MATLITMNNNNGKYAVAKAATDKAVVVFATGSEVKAVAFSVTGETVTVGSEVVLASLNSAFLGAAYLEDDKVVVTYSNDAGSTQLYGRVLTLVGLVISQGAEATIRASGVDENQVQAISSTRAGAVYAAGGQLYGKVLDISGTTIAANSEADVVVSGYNGGLDTAQMGAKAVITYFTTGSALAGRVIHSITTSFSVGSEATIEGAPETDITTRGGIMADTSASVMVIYNLVSPSADYRIRRLTESGNVLSVSSPVTLGIANAGPLQRSGIVATNGLGKVGVSQDSPAMTGLLVDYTVAGNFITEGESIDWDPYDTNAWHYRGANLGNQGVLLAWEGINGLFAIVFSVARYAKFYQGAGVLAEKFTLPFAGVNPGGLALDRTLGTVVIGADEPSNEAVIYSNYPYVTGTVSAASFPTGTSIQALRWI